MNKQSLAFNTEGQAIRTDVETPFAVIFYLNSSQGIETMSFPGLVYVGQTAQQYQAFASDGQNVILEKANVVGLHIMDIETYQEMYDTQS